VSDETAINVNFSRPMPLFPLEAVVLLPQQVIPLHVFEPRYRQMVQRVLDGAGQFALASFEGNRWKQEYHGRPPLRPAVCVAQIARHESAPDGNYTLLVQGVCRARIVRESPPEEGRLYREAKLVPVGLETGVDEDDLLEVRELLEELLEEGPLTRMAAATPVLKFVRDEEIPVPALLELVSFSLIARPDLMYGLLAEEDVRVRARMVLGELSYLESLIKRAAARKLDDAPKGVSWN
jgi:Lon protease-like protein